MAQRCLCDSDGEQMSTGSELFHVDSSRVVVAEGTLRFYLWTQRDQICHHAWCCRTVALDSFCQFTMPSL